MKLLPFLLFLAGALAAQAAVVKVTTLAALQAAINEAGAGDRIVVQNGTYAVRVPLVVACAGTAAAPVVIAAESIGGVEFSGSNGFMVVRPAAHVTIEGFRFTHVAGGATIGGGTTRVRFSRNVFNCSGVGPEIEIAGDEAEIDRNEFRDKKTIGNMISVSGTEDDVAQRLWIHHNHFHDYAKAGGNGAETIRYGRSWFSLSRGDGLVEHNLFERCVGENELITNKSGANTYRYNTFLDSPGAQLTIRHGNDCLVYGNYFRRTDGLRIFGDRHVVHSNYFEQNTRGINLGNGGAEVADGAKLTSHDRPDHCVIACNTLVANGTHYQMDNRRDGLGATHTVFAYNVIQGGGVAAKIAGPNAGAVWTGNIVWQTDPGAIPAGGFLSADPRLAAGPDGIFRPAAGSAAIDAALEAFPAIDVDMDGQPRTGKKDAGADEYSNDPIKARMLTPADVGPRSR